MIDVAEALKRERSFLERMSGAQEDYEWLITNEAWTALGHDSFADWWTARVVPVMRALSMRPTREITAKGIEQVKKEEEKLPRPQRRTQKDLGEMFGVTDKTAAARSRPSENSGTADLGEPTKRAQKRRPLPDMAKEAGWMLRRDVEKIERIYADDRYGLYKEAVAAHLHGHLTYTIETLARLLGRTTDGNEDT